MDEKLIQRARSLVDLAEVNLIDERCLVNQKWREAS